MKENLTAKYFVRLSQVECKAFGRSLDDIREMTASELEAKVNQANDDRGDSTPDKEYEFNTEAEAREFFNKLVAGESRAHSGTFRGNAGMYVEVVVIDLDKELYDEDGDYWDMEGLDRYVETVE